MAHKSKSSKGNKRRNWDEIVLKEIKVKNVPEMLKHTNKNEKE